MSTDPRRLADERFAELFLGLVAQPPEARRVQLDELASTDPERAEELHSLLAAHDRHPHRLETFDAEQAAELLRADEADSRPQWAGEFRLLEELGRGGIGVVYRGLRQGDGFEQQAAVKLIKRGMDSDLILERFRVERRILASLDHPNIAGLIDGGALEDGRPWFAMEFVEGETLTAWCDRVGASLERRLDLFERICSAVQYAHGRLIIHRDIKPANILVTRDGMVKLLDFGIAKLLGEEADADSPLTIAGMRAMTPEYAAPEQIRREPVSTATDVHALGMVLYQLLTGQHPFQRERDSRERLSEAICNTLPDAPSHRVDGGQATQIARQRGTRPKLLRRRLRGDLDNIVLKAMAKEPGRRYPSVEALAEDLRRFREGLPVKARRDSLAYRATRFVQRHRLGVAATAALIAVLVAGLAGVLYQADQARAEAHRAERSLAFLTDLFQSGDPRRGTLVESIDTLLDRAGEQVPEAFADDRLLHGSLLLRLAEVRLGRTQVVPAREMADRALELLRDELPDSDRRIADALRVAGASRYVMGKAIEAEPFLREAAAIYRDLGDLARESEMLTSVAGSLRSTQGFDAALELQRKVVARLEASPGTDAQVVSSARFAYGLFAVDAGDYALGERELRQAAELIEGDGPDAELHRADVEMALAGLLDRMGRGEEAGGFFQSSLDTFVRLLGEDSPSVASARFSLGLYLLGQDEHGPAEDQFRQVIGMANASSMMQAHARRYLGRALTEQQRFDEAAAWLEEAERDYLAVGGTSALEQAHRARADLGQVQFLLGDAAAGVASLTRAVAGIESIRGPEHYNLIQPLSFLAQALERDGQADEARDVAERSITLAESLLGPDHRLSRDTRQRHAALLSAPAAVQP